MVPNLKCFVGRQVFAFVAMSFWMCHSKYMSIFLKRIFKKSLCLVCSVNMAGITYNIIQAS